MPPSPCAPSQAVVQSRGRGSAASSASGPRAVSQPQHIPASSHQRGEHLENIWALLVLGAWGTGLGRSYFYESAGTGLGGGSGSGGRMRPSPAGSSRVPGEPPPSPRRPKSPVGNIRPGGAGKDPANFSGARGRELAGGAAVAGPPCTACGPPGAQGSRLGVTAPCFWGRTPRLTRTYRRAVPHGMGLPPALSLASSALASSLSPQRPGPLGRCQQSYRWLKVPRVPQRRGPVCPQGCRDAPG